jgi:hypothetical protein
LAALEHTVDEISQLLRITRTSRPIVFDGLVVGIFTVGWVA